jgi:hypothetical protein
MSEGIEDGPEFLDVVAAMDIHEPVVEDMNIADRLIAISGGSWVMLVSESYVWMRCGRGKSIGFLHSI